MAFKKVSKEELTPQARTILDDGWYQLAVTKLEAKQSKATQDMVSIQYRALSVENDPDSGVGSPIFGMVLFPSWGDDATFEQSIVDKKGLSGDDLAAEVKSRRRMAEDGAAQFAFALFGYDHFPDVPRKNKETGKYELRDGTEVNNAGDRAALYDGRKAEAINAAIEVATGGRDVTRYLVYAKIGQSTFNGETKNEIKAVKCYLPDGETLSFPTPF